MKYIHKYGTRPSEIRKAKKELYGRLSLVLLALLFFLFMFLIAKFQPGINNQKIEANAAEITEQAELSQSGSIDKITDEQLAMQSQTQEDIAETAWKNNEIGAAIEAMEKAIKFQSRINDQYPGSSRRSASRLHQLSRKLMLWQTQPLANEADALKEKAYRLAEQEQYTEARRTIREALGKQSLLMEEFRESTYSTLNRMRAFEEAKVEIDTAEDTTKVARLLVQTEEALSAGRWESALEMAEQAEILQQSVVQNFDTQKKEQLEILNQVLLLKDTAASWPVFRKIQTARNKTRTALSMHDMEGFQEQIAEWSRESDFMINRFQKSRFVEELHRKEVELLYRLRREIPSIIEMVANNMIPVPGHETLHMLKTEVPQALYESVTGVNPSSSKDFSKPVDSVTWMEASEFTYMLGTILARPVSLPERDTYIAAIGDSELTALAEQSWAAENSGRTVHACGELSANDAGFHDLLGNVAEWLAAKASDPSGKVVAIGGSSRDSAARLSSIPEDFRSPQERNRFIGFRFVVEHKSELR